MFRRKPVIFYEYDPRIHFESIVIMQDIDDYGIIRKILTLAPIVHDDGNIDFLKVELFFSYINETKKSIDLKIGDIISGSGILFNVCDEYIMVSSIFDNLSVITNEYNHGNNNTSPEAFLRESTNLAEWFSGGYYYNKLFDRKNLNNHIIDFLHSVKNNRKNIIQLTFTGMLFKSEYTERKKSLKLCVLHSHALYANNCSPIAVMCELDDSEFSYNKMYTISCEIYNAIDISHSPVSIFLSSKIFSIKVYDVKNNLEFIKYNEKIYDLILDTDIICNYSDENTYNLIEKDFSIRTKEMIEQILNKNKIKIQQKIRCPLQFCKSYKPEITKIRGFVILPNLYLIKDKYNVIIAKNVKNLEILDKEYGCDTSMIRSSGCVISVEDNPCILDSGEYNFSSGVIKKLKKWISRNQESIKLYIDKAYEYSSCITSI